MIFLNSKDNDNHHHSSHHIHQKIVWLYGTFKITQNLTTPHLPTDSAI